MGEPWTPTTPPGLHGEPQPRAANKQRLWGIVAGAVVALVVAGGIGFALGRRSAGPSPEEAAGAVAEQESRLESAFAACESRDSDNTLSLEDEGGTIVIDTGEYGDTFGMDCVLTQLDTPQSIQAQMGRTTAMMGVQEAEHEGIEYSWSYHPDNGVNMVITEAQAAS